MQPVRTGILCWVAALLAGGCATQTTDWSKEPLPVTVSAANYSELTREELYRRVNAPDAVHPVPPAVAKPQRPLFYGFVPGEVYDSDTPIQTVFQELAVPLAQRGYFNVVYEVKAGLLPSRVDYLLRVHCGVRPWKVPKVRTDKVTWGDDGLVSNWRSGSSIWRIGEDASIDPRQGQNMADIIKLATMLQEKAAPALRPGNSYNVNDMSDHGATRDYCLVVVEAFKFEDVAKLRKSAPCVWSTFIAVPLHTGQEFSGALRAMVRTAAPYFGNTADGIQTFDVPQGKVLLGEPVEVPAHPSAPATTP